MKMLSNGQESTLLNWLHLTATLLGPETKAFNFLKQKADEQGFDEEVIADEQQLLNLLSTMLTPCDSYVFLDEIKSKVKQMLQQEGNLIFPIRIELDYTSFDDGEFTINIIDFLINEEEQDEEINYKVLDILEDYLFDLVAEWRTTIEINE